MELLDISKIAISVVVIFVAGRSLLKDFRSYRWAKKREAEEREKYEAFMKGHDNDGDDQADF